MRIKQHLKHLILDRNAKKGFLEDFSKAFFTNFNENFLIISQIFNFILNFFILILEENYVKMKEIKKKFTAIFHENMNNCWNLL